MPALHPVRIQHLSGEIALTAGDAELLARSAAGNGAAFEQFVRRHEAALLAYLRRMTPDSARAEDALQETFLAAWRAAGQFAGGGPSARGWLFTIARHALERQGRRRAGEPADKVPLFDLGVAAGWGAEPAVDPQPALLSRDRLERAWVRLDDAEREVLWLREIEGLTGDECAASLGLTLPAVKSRLHRARLRLMAALREVDRHAH